MIEFRLVLYLVAALTCIACTVLLTREYFKTRIRLLLWSAVCFTGLTVNNVFLVLDLGVFPELDLRLLRLGAALTGMMVLLYAFVWQEGR